VKTSLLLRRSRVNQAAIYECDRLLQKYVFDSLINASTLYILTPRWIRWIDNSVEFNYKAELEL
jgi:hypothetical protein